MSATASGNPTLYATIGQPPAFPVVLNAYDDGAIVSFAGLPSETDTLYHIENIWGGSGNNSITGSGGSNELRGGNGADTLLGMAGDDTLWGQGGTDKIDGGAGSDTVVYSDNTTPVKVDLTSKLVTFPGKSWPSESVVSIENAITGSGNDTLIGGSIANVLDGGLGADRIDGRGGADTVSFASHASAVRIDLNSQRATVIGTSVTGHIDLHRERDWRLRQRRVGGERRRKHAGRLHRE